MGSDSTNMVKWLNDWLPTNNCCILGGSIAQWKNLKRHHCRIEDTFVLKHSCFPPSNSRFKSRLRRDFFSFLLSLWTVLRWNPSCAKQWISQMQLKVTSGAKYYKKIAAFFPGLNSKSQSRDLLLVLIGTNVLVFALKMVLHQTA